GTVLPFAGTVAPGGYLLADGTAVSRTTFARLFAAIGTTFGAGDGATTFNLPDMRQRFPLGKAASGTGNVLGQTGGAIDHTHSGPSHSHTNPTISNTSNSGAVGSSNTPGLVSISTFQAIAEVANNMTTPRTHTHTQGNTGLSGTGQTGSN